MEFWIKIDVNTVAKPPRRMGGFGFLAVVVVKNLKMNKMERKCNSIWERKGLAASGQSFSQTEGWGNGRTRRLLIEDKATRLDRSDPIAMVWWWKRFGTVSDRWRCHCVRWWRETFFDGQEAVLVHLLFIHRPVGGAKWRQGRRKKKNVERGKVEAILRDSGAVDRSGPLRRMPRAAVMLG